MKICLFSSPTYVHTQRWAHYFSEQGHEVSIIGDGEIAGVPYLSGVKVYRLESDKFKGPWILRTTLALKRLLDQIKPDIMHIHYLTAMIAPVILRFKPLVVSVWGADIVGKTGLANNHWRGRFLKRTVLRKADTVIALSKFLADATCKYADLPAERVLIHYWGVDLNQFSPKHSGNGDSIVIGFIKALLPKYGPEYLLRAIPIIRTKYPQIKVIMVGEGPLREELEKLAIELKVHDIVTFCGQIPHTEVPDYLEKMDIFVMPSVYESETFGVAAVEASAMGIPVVASNIGGIPEAVSDGITGILVKPRDPNDIAKAVIQLIENDDLRKSISQEGPRFVAQHFDWEKNATQVEELYRNLLKRKRN